MQPTDRIREDVREFTPYAPGLSMEEIKERYGLARVVKLASNENPLGASPLVKRVLARKADMVFRYPRAGNPALVAALAEAHGVPRGCVVAGNGSDEIIDLLVRVTCRPGVDNVVAFAPCFSIYVQQTKLCGVELRQPPLGPDFAFDLPALAGACDAKTALVFLTNPDNPSGYAVPADQVVALAKSLPPRALLVVDEAYVEFADPEADHSMLPRWGQCDNVVVLRTFSKLYGLAGLRLGLGVMPEWLADYLLRVRLPFSVNLLAEAAGIAALEDTPFRQASLETVLRGRRLLAEKLTGLGCRVYPSKANFLMFAPPSPQCGAADVFKALLGRGIIIRALKSYGLPELLRVSIGNDEENDLFLAAMKDLVENGC
ncbi:histidinol-phosphate aminotransferase [Solidesulfovibrio carbinoliphilus subsp. oakridgensis]|uniref:Histidinol-phosphate aminotransferase n=1 Tax=Solidesulfovibrio carbinoliphilus subsp. oakridgensis TaxID=694327 RepID=G7Q6P4_9BACT|nr:histidinol-phosphate transaminase [Solidesulfovibrio carbinoliphilus]EHJ47979.1 histidinol-phosphate aminotransferase [Solidesulfovibrio carbinoliphilus subsp. oakridgensis]